MNDYRYTQIEELEHKIQETKLLLEDPTMAELAKEEIQSLEKQKQEIEENLQNSNNKNEENYDSRNILLEVSGAAGGDEAKLWATELMNIIQTRGRRSSCAADPNDRKAWTDSHINSDNFNSSGIGGY